MVFCCTTLKVTPHLYPSDWASASTDHRSELKDCLATLYFIENKMGSIFLFSQFLTKMTAVFPDFNLQDCSAVRLYSEMTFFFFFKTSAGTHCAPVGNVWQFTEMRLKSFMSRSQHRGLLEKLDLSFLIIEFVFDKFVSFKTHSVALISQSALSVQALDMLL